MAGLGAKPQHAAVPVAQHWPARSCVTAAVRRRPTYRCPKLVAELAFEPLGGTLAEQPRLVGLVVDEQRMSSGSAVAKPRAQLRCVDP